MEKTHLFHFFSSRLATRFHIARRLLAKGWQETSQIAQASFADTNLTLNDEISKYLEYKHLLAALVAKNCPDIMPITYHVNDENYQTVFAKMIFDHYMINNIYQKEIKDLKWILKPSMLNNGDNIFLFNNIEELKAHYATISRLGGDHVIQRYISDPDLIGGRKYTFRVAAVITNYAGVFLYKQGYINISGYPFDLNDGFKNKKVHITNYVIDGEFAHIEQRATQTIEDFSEIYQQMCAIVLATMQGLLKKAPGFLQPQKKQAFEIFGFDFMRDQKGKIWLIEINQAPDAPTFEENKLDNILWDVFWQDIIDDFVLPIALKVPPKRQYAHFTQILTSSQCYCSWRHFWHKLVHRS
jgi:tubulin--tyrosine ligase